MPKMLGFACVRTRKKRQKRSHIKGAKPSGYLPESENKLPFSAEKTATCNTVSILIHLVEKGNRKWWISGMFRELSTNPRKFVDNEIVHNSSTKVRKLFTFYPRKCKICAQQHRMQRVIVDKNAVDKPYADSDV